VNSPAMPHRKPAGTSSSLTVRNLKKRYGSRTVVKDVSLDVKSGEVQMNNVAGAVRIK